MRRRTCCRPLGCTLSCTKCGRWVLPHPCESVSMCCGFWTIQTGFFQYYPSPSTIIIESFINSVHPPSQLFISSLPPVIASLVVHSHSSSFFLSIAFPICSKIHRWCPCSFCSRHPQLSFASSYKLRLFVTFICCIDTSYRASNIISLLVDFIVHSPSVVALSVPTKHDSRRSSPIAFVCFQTGFAIDNHS